MIYCSCSIIVHQKLTLEAAGRGVSMKSSGVGKISLCDYFWSSNSQVTGMMNGNMVIVLSSNLFDIVRFKA